jgi:hypothetical protein
MPKYDKIGKLSMTLLPPSGAPISANVELEIVEAGQGGYVAPKEESDEDSSLTPAAKEELDAYSDEDKT